MTEKTASQPEENKGPKRPSRRDIFRSIYALVKVSFLAGIFGLPACDVTFEPSESLDGKERKTLANIEFEEFGGGRFRRGRVDANEIGDFLPLGKELTPEETKALNGVSEVVIVQEKTAEEEWRPVSFQGSMLSKIINYNLAGLVDKIEESNSPKLELYGGISKILFDSSLTKDAKLGRLNSFLELERISNSEGLIEELEFSAELIKKYQVDIPDDASFELMSSIYQASFGTGRTLSDCQLIGRLAVDTGLFTGLFIPKGGLEEDLEELRRENMITVDRPEVYIVEQGKGEKDSSGELIASAFKYSLVFSDGDKNMSMKLKQEEAEALMEQKGFSPADLDIFKNQQQELDFGWGLTDLLPLETELTAVFRLDGDQLDFAYLPNKLEPYQAVLSPAIFYEGGGDVQAIYVDDGELKEESQRRGKNVMKGIRDSWISNVSEVINSYQEKGVTEFYKWGLLSPKDAFLQILEGLVSINMNSELDSRSQNWLKTSIWPTDQRLLKLIAADYLEGVDTPSKVLMAVEPTQVYVMEGKELKPFMPEGENGGGVLLQPGEIFPMAEIKEENGRDLVVLATPLGNRLYIPLEEALRSMVSYESRDEVLEAAKVATKAFMVAVGVLSVLIAPEVLPVAGEVAGAGARVVTRELEYMLDKLVWVLEGGATLEGIPTFIWEAIMRSF